MGNPIRINLSGETIKTILEAPGAKVNAHLVVTKDGDGITPSELEWKEPGTPDNRINKNLLPQITKEDDGKILIAQNGEWKAVTLTQLLAEYGITKESILLAVQKLDEV